MVEGWKVFSFSYPNSNGQFDYFHGGEHTESVQLKDHDGLLSVSFSEENEWRRRRKKNAMSTSKVVLCSDSSPTRTTFYCVLLLWGPHCKLWVSVEEWQGKLTWRERPEKLKESFTCSCMMSSSLSLLQNMFIVVDLAKAQQHERECQTANEKFGCEVKICRLELWLKKLQVEWKLARYSINISAIYRLVMLRFFLLSFDIHRMIWNQFIYLSKPMTKMTTSGRPGGRREINWAKFVFGGENSASKQKKKMKYRTRWRRASTYERDFHARCLAFDEVLWVITALGNITRSFTATLARKNELMEI